MSDNVPKEIIDEIEEFEDAQTALAQVMAKDIPLPRKPTTEEKELADNFKESEIGDLDDKTLMKYFGVFVGFQAYAEWELARFDGIQKCAKSSYDFTLAIVTLQAPEKTPKMKDIWAKTRQVVQQAQKKKLEAEARYELLKSLAKGYEKNSQLCSRELSRRTSPTAQFQGRGITT